MNKKILYLFLALLLPGLVFLFLKYFGKNEFDIPVYYQEGITSLSSECNIVSKGQYLVNDSTLKWPFLDGYSMLVSFASDKEVGQVRKLIEEEQFDHIQLVTLDSSNNIVKKCVLFLKHPWNTVLVDNQKRIRGYYKIGDREEMDRLNVELKILLKKY